LRLGGSRRLAGLISRYGDAIEADLPHYYPGVRMRQVWTGELTPREALNLIENLPRGSRFQAALADDDELADEIGDLVEGRPPPPPPLTEWTADHEKLTLIADRLGELLHLTAAANSSKRVPQYRPLARPETALQRKARRRRAAKRELIADRLAAAKAAARPHREVTWPSRRALRSCRSSPVCAVSKRGSRRRRPPQAGRQAGRSGSRSGPPRRRRRRVRAGSPRPWAGWGRRRPGRARHCPRACRCRSPPSAWRRSRRPVTSKPA